MLVVHALSTTKLTEVTVDIAKISRTDETVLRSSVIGSASCAAFRALPRNDRSDSYDQKNDR
jgi:hypothetical protein